MDKLELEKGVAVAIPHGELLKGLKDRFSGKISQDELNVICANFTHDHLDEYQFEGNPAEPKEYEEFIDARKKWGELSDAVQKALNAKFGWYSNELDRIRNKNITSAEWLYYCRNILRDIDGYKAIALDAALQRLQKHIGYFPEGAGWFNKDSARAKKGDSSG